MSIYEELKLLSENPNLSPEARAAARRLYDELQATRSDDPATPPPAATA